MSLSIMIFSLILYHSTYKLMYLNLIPDMGPDSHLSNVHLTSFKRFQTFFIPWADQDAIGWDWSIIMDHTRVAEILSMNFRIDFRIETFRKYLGSLRRVRFGGYLLSYHCLRQKYCNSDISIIEKIVILLNRWFNNCNF